MTERTLTLCIGMCLTLGVADLAVLNVAFAPAALQADRSRHLSSTPGAADLAETPSSQVAAIAATPSATVPVAAVAPPATRGRGDRTPAVVTIRFGRNRSGLQRPARSTLDAIADRLSEDSTLSVQVQGHASCRGTERHNDSLARQRAESVAAYLSERGIAAQRLRVEWFGERRPSDDRDSARAHRRNRRVELRWIEVRR